MTNEEFKELWENDELDEVNEELDDSWRHGNNVTTTFKAPDGTFWDCYYQVSGDGEYNGIRDDEFEIAQVWPREVTITKIIYESVNPNEV